MVVLANIDWLEFDTIFLCLAAIEKTSNIA